MEANPDKEPRADGPQNLRPLLRFCFWQAVAFGGLTLALDLGGALYRFELGVAAIIVRVALLVGGLTACAIGLAYLVVQGRRSELGVGLLIEGPSLIVLSIALTAVWAFVFA